MKSFLQISLRKIMLHKIKPILLASAFIFPFALHAGEIVLTANRNNGSGVLPSGFSRLTFNTYDGDWADKITLPAKPADRDVVSITTDATYDSTLDALKTDFPVKVLHLTRGDQFDFTFNAASKLWVIGKVRKIDPNSRGANITTESARLTRYSLSDGNWLPDIFLPATAREGDLVAIHSDATWPAKVSAQNLLFASSFGVQTGDTYVFVYRADLKKWVPETAPVRNLPVAAAVATPTTPRSLLLMQDGRWVPELILPAVAGDRDRVTIRSDATYESLIRNQNVNFAGAMRLRRGQQYEFLYVRENALWEVTASPLTVMPAQNFPNGVLPALTTPRGIVKVPAGWSGALTLPAKVQKDSRIIIESGSDKSFKIAASKISVTINPGETVVFKAYAANQWKQETRTIDLLLLYSDKVAVQFGEGAARARMYESFSLTNEALENSGANFRFRMVGLRKFASPAEWANLGDPLSLLRNHPLAQQWRNELKADGIYYEGTEEGCGLAYVGADSYSMVATGSTACGTTVMRHEMGHNMSLSHADTNTAGYAQGYSAVRSIMGGNEIPFYSTPWRFTTDLGVRMGIVDKIDAVRAMNEFSAQASAFR
jgi:hypothetical protein